MAAGLAAELKARTNLISIKSRKCKYCVRYNVLCQLMLSLERLFAEFKITSELKAFTEETTF